MRLRLRLAGRGRSTEHSSTLYRGDIAFFAKPQSSRRLYGIARDKSCDAYVLYRGGHIERVDCEGDLETIFNKAIAYMALTGSHEGFPEVTFPPV
jgi:hypothetical protein